MIAAPDMIERLRKHGAELGAVSEGDAVGIQGVVPESMYKDTGPDKDDIVALATTQDIDLDGEVVVAKGMDREYFTKNKKLFADHNYGIEDVAGHLRTMGAYPSTKDHRGWMIRFRLSDSPIGKAVRTIIEESGGIGLSIGFVATDYGPPTDEERELYAKGGESPTGIIRSGRIFETSLTALPCNVSCQTMQVSGGDEKRAGELEGLVTKGLIDRKWASALGVPVTPKRKVFVVPEVPKRVLRVGA